MAIKSLSSSSLTNNVFYRSLLAGNEAFNPSDEDVLAETVLTSSASSVTFSSLDTLAAGYQHLQVRFVARDSFSANDRAVDVRINGDSVDKYSSHRLLGNGSSVSSNAYSNQPLLNNIGSITGNSAATGDFGAGVLDVLDAFETTKNKTFRMLSGHAGNVDLVILGSGLYMDTDALTSIQFIPASNFVTGSTFTLIGIK